MRAAIYTRISKDRDGQSESPERQEQIARALCESKGWEVVATFTDLDLSAYRKGVRRPGYEALLDAARTGRIDAIVVWSVTRLSRTVREFSRLLDELDELGVALTSARDPIDTSTATGRAMAQIHGVFAELESATISSRARDANDYARRQGRPFVGGSRAFGWRGAEQDPDEAPIVREVAERLLRGETRAAVARDLNARGIRTAAGNEWTGYRLWQMVTAPRHAGLRIYDGEVFEGSWEPILDRATHHRLLAMSTRSAAPRSRSLLAGLLVCGACFKNMHSRKINGVPSYSCRSSLGWEGCGRVSTRARRLEEHVRDSVLGFLARAEMAPARSDSSDLDRLRAQVAEDEAALVSAAEAHFVQRTMTAEAYAAVISALDARIAEARAAIEAAEDLDAEAEALPSGDLEAWWEDASGDERRALLRRAVRQVIVHPVGKTGRNWRPDRVEIRWNYELFLDAAAEIEPDEAEYERIRREAERE